MSGTTSIKAINAIAIARGTSEPSNRNVLWLDENITGSFYKIIKSFNSESGTWELLSRSNSELLSDLKTVDGKGSGLDADTLHGLTPAELLGGELSSLPDLSIGQIIAGQADTIGVAKTVGGVVTMDADGNFAYTPNSISHTGLTDIGTNTHAQIDSKLASIDNIEGNLTNIGTLGASEDGYSIAWDNATSRFIPTAGGNSIYTADGTLTSNRVVSFAGQSLDFNTYATNGGIGIGDANDSTSHCALTVRATTGKTQTLNLLTNSKNGLASFHEGLITMFAPSYSAVGTEDISLQKPTAIKGTGTSGDSALTIYDNDTTPNKLWDFLDNGNVNLGADSVVNLENSGQDNSLEFKTKDGVYSSFGFAKISGQGDVSIMCNGSSPASALTVYSSDNPTNTVIAPLKIARFYSGTSHLCSRFINIGYNLTTNYLNIQDSTLKFKGSGVDVHTIEHVNANSYVSFFVNGIGNGGFIVGNNTKIGTEDISLQGDTILNAKVSMPNLPTSATGLATGDLWNDGGTVKIA